MEDLQKEQALADRASARTSDARQSLTAGPQASADGARQPSLADAGDSAPGPSSVARHNVITLLRLAGLDANLDRLRQSMAGLLEAVERKRSDLATLGELIEKDRTRRAGQESEAILEACGRRLLVNGRTYARLADDLKLDEAGALTMSCELRRKTARLANERDRVLARLAAPLRERHEAALHEGQRPVLAALQEGRCSGCGKALPTASRMLVEASPSAVPCSGCLRLLYDRGWVERGFLPPAPRQVTRAKA